MSFDDGTCLLIDVQVSEGNRIVYATKQLLQNENDSFAETIEAVLAEYAATATATTAADDVVLGEESDGEVDPIKVQAQALLGRVKSVKCVGKPTELYKFLERSGLPLKTLNSPLTPIFNNGIVIDLAPKEVRAPPTKDKANLRSFNDILMGTGEPSKVRFLPAPAEELDPKLDKQIKGRLITLLSKDIELGYFSVAQREYLEKNVGTLVSALCFVQKHWSKLLHRDFPHVPAGNNSLSSLLELVSECTRGKASSDRLTVGVLSTHCGKLSGLNWSAYSRSKRLKGPLNSFKDEIERIRAILLAKKSSMIAHNATSTNLERRAPSAFESLPNYVQLDSDVDEFFVAIPPSVGSGKKPRGRKTDKSRAVDKAIKNLRQALRVKDDYVPIFLKDEDMGIVDGAFDDAGGTAMLDASERAYHRQQFKTKLAKGLDGINVNVFGRTRKSLNNPTCIFVWKVPPFCGDEHPGNVQRAIDSSRKILPKKLGEESMRHFNNLLKGISGVPAGVRKAMRNYLFMGEVNATGDIADEYCQFVVDLAAGIEADMSLIVDGRQFNSRGGKGIGGTLFDEFWAECRQILLPTATTEERRHSDEMFASNVLSIPDLVRRATKSLEAKVDSGEWTEMPQVPSKEFVRLQFVPNNHTVEAASKFSGKLGVKRAVQTRTLRKQHIDQHWVNALTRYVLEWLVELRRKSPSSVEFFGQDDKAKIPVGDKVAVSTGVRANGTAIVDATAIQPLQAMDHDFHYANLTPSVTLRCNIPEEMGGSFFTGGEEGYGQIFVTLRDSIFDPSTVFDHTAQLIDMLQRQSLDPSVLVLQTDGGPDHSLKRLQTKLALLAFFKERDLDHLLVIRCAPNGSAHNKVERSMSQLNIGLMHVATKRAVMPPFAEEAIQNCNSMGDVRAKEEKMRELQEAAKARVAELDKMDRDRAVRSMFELTLNRHLDRAEANVDPRCDMVNAVDMLMALIGAKAPALNEAGAVSGVVENGDGTQQNVFSTSILDSIASAKREEAERIVAQDFRAAWDDSIGVPIEMINGRFAQLRVGGRPVVVYPRVESEVEKRLHEILLSVDEKYKPELNLSEHLRKMPDIKAWFEVHCVWTTYSLSMQKCGDTSCCGEFRSPPALRSLVLQRQPTPRMDTSDASRKNHFYSRGDALRLFAGNAAALTDLSDLPSKKNADDSAANDKKARDTRDAKINKEFGLKSWDAKKVRGVVKCFHCAKPRCLFSTKKDAAYDEAAKALQQKLELISFRFSCDDLIFEDDTPVGKVITQRQKLTCESNVEKAYYNHSERALKVEEVCIHCGEEGSNEFLLRQEQLESRNMTAGKQCFPICLDCVGKKKKVVHYPKKKANNSQKRKEAQANKSAAQTAHAAKKSKN